MTALDFVPALATFAFASSITPGPNNLMLLDAGARFGFRRALPTLLGVVAGFQLLLLACYLGVATFVEAWPAARELMAWLCALYLAWLAVRSLRSSGTPATDLSARAAPPRWFEAVLLQFVNPKAWGMTITGATIASAAAGPVAGGVGLLAVFATVGAPCSATWLAGGAALRPLLGDPRRRRRFDAAMAGLLLATAAWMVWPSAPGAA